MDASASRQTNTVETEAADWPLTPMVRSARSVKAAVILGGAHGTIALARVLKRHGFAVWLVSDDTPLPRFSAALSHRLSWQGPGSGNAVAVLNRLAEENQLHGALLIPAADADVRFVSTAKAELQNNFHVLVPEWERLRWATNKGLAYRRAQELGLGAPHTYSITSPHEVRSAKLQFPVVLKPSMRLGRNRFTVDKAWRADNLDQFVRLYEEASDLVGADHIIVQELVPGCGQNQWSYAGLWNKGEPILSFTARRLRQYPLEFSYTSTYVETAHAPDVRKAAETFLRSIGHHGLVEIEFKRDTRDGKLKLLDVNPRPWSWLSLADAAGVDFGAGIRAITEGTPPPVQVAREGVGWLFAIRDLFAAVGARKAGHISVADYLGTLKRVRAFAAFSKGDPLPALLEMPLTAWRVLARRVARKR